MTASSGKRKVVVILNGISLKKKFFYKKILPSLQREADVEVMETRSNNDAITLASKAADNNYDLVLAAGGDGTLNQVVNGILQNREIQDQLPAIGLIPIGSGNDFARTANIKAEAHQLSRLIRKFEPKPIDVGKIIYSHNEGNTGERYFVNVADIGMGPMVVQKVSNSSRSLGHAFAYYKSIITTFLDYKPMVVQVESDEWSWKGKVRSLGITNGKYYGHGLCIAPDAKPDDGIFAVFICGNVSVLDFIFHTSALKKGKHIYMPEVHYKNAETIKLTSESTCLIEGDGEILGMLPASVSIMERKLRFLI